MKSKFLLLSLLLLATLARAQNVRWDLGAPGSAGAVTLSSLGTLRALSGVGLNWCVSPANALPCTNFAPTFTGPSSATSCPSTSPIVPQGSSVCSATSDNLGRLGVWTAAGTYDYTLTVNGVVFGPYTVTVGGGGGGSGIGGCTIANIADLSCASFSVPGPGAGQIYVNVGPITGPGVTPPGQAVYGVNSSTGNFTCFLASGADCAPFVVSSGIISAAIQPGVDIGAKVNAAIAKLPSAPNGGQVNLPCGVNSFSTPIVFDRPVYLKGCGGSFGSTGGTVLRWSGGTSVPIQITNSNALGSVLEGFALDNTGTGTVGIDLDNSQYYTTLRNIYIQPTVGFSVAAVRIGNTALCPLTHIEQSIISGNAVGLQILKSASMSVMGGGIYGNSTNDVQLGDSTHEAFQTSFFGTEIESVSTGVVSVSVKNVEGVYFYGVYTETTGAAGYFLDIPSSATNAKNVVFSGVRSYGNLASTRFLTTNFAAATLSIEDSYFSGFNGTATVIINTSAAHIWTNNINTDSTVTAITNSTTNYNAGPNSLNGAITAFQIGDNVQSNVYSLFARRSQGNRNFCDFCGDGVHQLVLGDANGVNVGSGPLSVLNFIWSPTAPTISSGFGTSPSILANNGSPTFRVNVGTGGTASAGVIGMPTLSGVTAWNCSVNNLTAAAGNRADNTRQTASTATTVSVQNQTTSTGAAVAWTASDTLVLNCASL